MKLAVVIGLSLRNSRVMFPAVVSSRTLVGFVYSGSCEAVGEVEGEADGAAVGDGVGVGVGVWFAGCPSMAYAPTATATMAITATARISSLLLDLRLLGVIKGDSTAVYLILFPHSENGGCSAYEHEVLFLF
jgi:hypothetical protein